MLISNYARYYKLVNYLSRYTQKNIGLALGVPSLREIFDEKFYTDLDGGLLESLGRLFKNSVKLYVYPWRDPVTGKVTSAENLRVAPHLQNLYAYLVENRFVESIHKHNVEYLPIFSRDVLARIQTYDPSWETMVPAEVVESDQTGKDVRLPRAEPALVPTLNQSSRSVHYRKGVALAFGREFYLGVKRFG